MLSSDQAGRVFHQNLGQLVLDPYVNWKNALKDFSKHQSNSWHREVPIWGKNFLATLNRQKTSIVEVLWWKQNTSVTNLWKIRHRILEIRPLRVYYIKWFLTEPKYPLKHLIEIYQHYIVYTLSHTKLVSVINSFDSSFV